MSGIPFLSCSEETRSEARCQVFSFFICFTDKDRSPSGSLNSLPSKILNQRSETHSNLLDDTSRWLPQINNFAPDDCRPINNDVLAFRKLCLVCFLRVEFWIRLDLLVTHFREMQILAALFLHINFRCVGILLVQALDSHCVFSSYDIALAGCNQGCFVLLSQVKVALGHILVQFVCLHVVGAEVVQA